METPPSPIGRAIGATLVALFVLALAWASLSHVDIVASATGRIIPTGHSKVIQPFETGVVRAIHVSDGQNVNAGDVLIELDPTILEGEVNHLQSDLLSAQLDVARLRAALATPTTRSPRFARRPTRIQPLSPSRASSCWLRLRNTARKLLR